ncbi:MAG TPA: YdcF family protein [Candidatus Faecousia intestinigallinarum]|nr:YdcF family protein [Candidatus Faecousia intestinigallinarum]
MRKPLAGWLCCGGFALLGMLILCFAPGYDFSGLMLLGVAAVIACYTGLLRLGKKKKKLARGLQWVLSICLSVGAAAAIFTGAVILQASAGTPEAECDYIIVLGAGVNGTEPSRSLSDRLQAAYAYLTEHPDSTAIVSGAQGIGEDISEAECMFRELTAMGIAPERVWKEEQAANTRENLQFSLDLIEQRTGKRPAAVGLVSSDYHLYRAGEFAREQQVLSYGIPARTTAPHLFLNYFLREIAAVWYYIVLGG